MHYPYPLIIGNCLRLGLLVTSEELWRAAPFSTNSGIQKIFFRIFCLIKIDRSISIEIPLEYFGGVIQSRKQRQCFLHIEKWRNPLFLINYLVTRRVRLCSGPQCSWIRLNNLLKKSIDCLFTFFIIVSISCDLSRKMMVGSTYVRT